jgi:hypothetical protein
MALEIEMEDGIRVRPDLLRLGRRETYRGYGEEGDEKAQHV